jgi:hypothetical protein
MFKVALDTLDYPRPRERQVKLWREMIHKKMIIPPIKVHRSPRLPPDKWAVVSGAPVIEAAKREGITTLDAVVF